MADGLLTSLARFVRTLGQGRTFDSLNGMTQGRKLATRTSASSLPLVVESALDDCGSLLREGTCRPSRRFVPAKRQKPALAGSTVVALGGRSLRPSRRSSSSCRS